MSEMESNGSIDTERIVVDPRVMVGKAVIRGTRITVSLVLNLIANGYSFEHILDEYPVLTEADVRAAVLYASDILDRREVRDLVPAS